jgi:antirestriction protein ArdC
MITRRMPRTGCKSLKNDKRAIFTAASHGERAADYLNSLQKSESAAA